MSFPAGSFRGVRVFAAALLVAACGEPTSIPSTPSAVPIAGSQSLALTSSQEVLPAPQGRVIVRFRQNSPPGLAIAAAARARAVEAFALRHGAKVQLELHLPRAWVIETTAGDEERLASILSDDDAVEWAEVDQPIILQPCETGDCLQTNDSFRGYKWDLHNSGFIVNSAGVQIGVTGQVDADIDWLETYDAFGGNFGGTATIGIVDTGILPTHQDLTGRVVGARNFAALYPATLTQDRNSHGTHVAGIAAARTNNGLGVMGVAFGSNIRLLNAKACEWYNFGPPIGIATSCFTSSVSNAIMWAADNGANVINLSLGGPSPSALQQSALQYARSKGVVPFCATGNEGSATVISYPARYPECVAVGSTNWSDVRASYSNAGAEIELSAPGGDGASLPLGNSLVLATVPSVTLFSPPGSVENNVTYGWKAGTSMATPQAVGLAALLVANGLSASAAVDRMIATADDIGAPGWDTFFGAGRINACRAIDPAQVRVEMPGGMNTRDANGIVPVTLFGGPRFTVEQFDVAVLTLGDGSGAETEVALRDGEYRSAIADVDLDGVMDLTLKFSRAELIANGDLQPGLRTMVLGGNVGCRRVEGTQVVRIQR